MITHYPNSYRINIREGVLRILSTLLQLDGKCDLQTLCLILKGDDNVAPDFTGVATYGEFAHYHHERIYHLTNYLLNHNYLKSECNHFGCLVVSEKGLAFYEMPSDLIVRTQELKTSPYDNALRAQLCDLREELCETESLPTFRIFTDYVIQRVVQDRPANLEQLQTIPGIGAFKAQKYGERILRLIQNVALTAKTPLAGL